MEAGRPSRTAELIAMYRALHLEMCKDPILVDPWAIKMIRRTWRALVKSQLARTAYIRFVADLRPAMMSFMVRSRVAEDLFAAKARAGDVQWVLLGAGLDTFAWRHPEYADISQFEVDHPSTQAHKRALLAKLGLVAPEEHRFVAVDFERERISDRLRAAGFDASVPTVFAWLGVAYYLTRDAIVSTLADVASIAAPGSVIVCDYRMPDRFIAPAIKKLVDKADRILTRWGEPHITKLEPADWVALGSSTGWTVEQDLDHVALDAAFARGDGLHPMSHFRVLTLARA